MTGKGSTQKLPFERALLESNQLKNRAKSPSPLSRLALVLFTTGLALLLVAILGR